MVLEVMGRYAGWIALYGFKSDNFNTRNSISPDSVIEKLIIDTRRIKFSIIVVAEGAKPVDGEMVVSKMVTGSHDQLDCEELDKIANDIEITTVESRVTVLGHLQRGGGPIPYDRILSTRYGVAAVEQLVEGNSDVMVSLKDNVITSVPLVEAIREIRKVPVDSDIVLAAKALGISFGD